MSQAPKYARRKDFAQDEGDRTDHVALNAELDDAALSINSLRANLAKIQRDDGALRDGLVNEDTLAPAFKVDLKQELYRDIQPSVAASQKAAREAQAAEQGARAAEQTSVQSARTATDKAAHAEAQARAAEASARAAHLNADDIRHRLKDIQKLRTPADNTVSEPKLVDQAVTTRKLAPHAVTADKLAPEAVAEDQLAAHAVTADKLAPEAVTADQLALEAVTENKLAPKAVTEDKLASEAVTEAQLAPAAVTKDKLAPQAVTADKLANRAVTELKLANQSVTAPKLASYAVTGNKLAPGAVVAHLGYTPANLAKTWTTDNFNPNSKANAGWNCSHQPPVYEFGQIHPPGSADQTFNMPNPYVWIGWRIVGGGAGWIWPHGIILRNQ